MSDITKQIRNNFQSLIGTTLGADWSVLDNKYNLENNNLKNSTKRFGVIMLSGSDPGEGVLKHYTIDRVFNVTLLQKYTGRLNTDSVIESALDTLEDALDEIAKAAFNQKLGIPTVVLNATLDTIDDPDFDTLENTVILNASFIVRYRAKLN